MASAGETRPCDSLYIGPAAGAGRGLFAASSLSQGQSVYSVPHAATAALNDILLKTTCSNCFTSNTDQNDNTKTCRVKACRACHVVYYCSRKCQAQAWKNNHQFECDLFAGFKRQGKTLPNGARLVLQMINCMLRKQDCFASLKSHLDTIVQVGGERKSTLDALAYGLHLYIGRRVSLDDVRKLFALVFTNGTTLMTAYLDPIGVCVDPFASLANHSCDPNAFVMFDGPKLEIRTLKPISKHEELTIGYVETTNPYNIRQEELLREYYFTCNCAKCLNDRSRTSDRALAPELVDSEREVFGLLNEMRRISTSEDQENVTLALELKVQAALDLLTRKNAWPEYRQPLASLRHEQFTLLLSCNKPNALLHAFKIGSKVVFEIVPVLYPHKHHPVRVIRTWTLARLAMHIAREDTRVGSGLCSAGVDLNVVIFGLLKEVMASVAHSHGMGSAFFREVKAVIESIITQVGAETSNRSWEENLLEKFHEEQLPILKGLSRGQELNRTFP